MAVPGNLSGEEGAPVKPKREMEQGGRWVPVGGTREHPPHQGASTPVVLPAHPGESQLGHPGTVLTPKPLANITPTAYPFPWHVP